MADRSLFDEFRQRRVFQVAAIYLAVAWGAVEILDTVAARLFLPVWIPTLVVILFVVGFPVAMVLAWTFDIGKEGVRRTATPAGKASLIAAFTLMVAGTVGLYYLIRPALYEATGDVDLSDYVATDASLVVMPFIDVDGDDEALADEFSSRLIQVMRTIPALRVAGRDSSFFFKGRGNELKTISDMLDVAHLLEGTFRRSASGLRVSARLLIAHTGQVVWSETWEEPTQTLNEVETSIAQGVARALGVEVTQSDETSLRARPSTTVAVLELLARANRQYRTRTRDGFMRAIELTQQAAKLDPEYSPAWVNRAYLELSFWANLQHRPVEEALDVARAALIRAADLGNNSPEFHVATGALLRREGHNYGYTPEREEQLVAALERGIAAKSEQAYILYAIYLRRRAEYELAGELLRALLAQDPLHRVGNLQYNRILMLTEQTERAMEGTERLISWYPDYMPAYQDLADFFVRQGHYNKAIAWFERGARSATQPLSSSYRISRAYAWLGVGEIEEAAELFEELADDAVFAFHGKVVPCSLRGDLEQCYEIASAEVSGRDKPRRDHLFDTGILAMSLARYDDAIRWFELGSPELTSRDDPEVNMRTVDDAVRFAIALKAIGDNDRAQLLLNRATPLIDRRKQTMTEVYFHITRGENEKALTVFRQMVDNGWVDTNLEPIAAARVDPFVQAIADDPDYLRLMERVQHKLAQQRENLARLLTED